MKSSILLQNASSFLNETRQFSQFTIHWKPVLQISDREYLCHQAPGICRLQHFLTEIYLPFRLASHSSSWNAILNHLIQIYPSEPFTDFPLPTWQCKASELGCEVLHKPAPIHLMSPWLFWDRVSCSPAWPSTQFVAEDDLKLLILLLPFLLFWDRMCMPWYPSLNHLSKLI